MKRINLRQSPVTVVALAFAFGLGAQTNQVQTPNVFEILADHDSRYKIAGMKEPVITVHAGQQVTLRITAVKAKEHARDGHPLPYLC